MLALGIARDITTWAVQWLVAVCAGGPAVCGSVAWTLDVASGRAKLMGRRSLASTVFPGYFVWIGVLQATFTGAQLRAGAAVYGFMVAGLFGPANWQAVKVAAKERIARRHRDQAAEGDEDAHGLSSGSAEEPLTSAAIASAGPDGSKEGLSEYNWEPYFQRFGDMLPQDAVTSTMLAFGQLMNDWHGYNQPNELAPPAVRVAQVMKQAHDFVIGMVEPLFGRKRSSKLHEVLCHAAEEIELREDFSMADTSPNEQTHKYEKAGYKKTNRHAASVGRQLLREVQSRNILKEERRKLAALKIVEAGPIDDSSHSGYSSDTDSSSSSDASSAEECRATDTTARDAGVRATGGVSVAVELLAKRPGLAALAHVLGVPAYATVSMLTATHFTATYEWQALRFGELMRSAEDYYNAPWLDCVLYRGAAGGEALYGQVRLIISGGASGILGPCAVVQRLRRADPLPDSPFAAAGYQRLQWAFDDDAAEWPSLEAVPVENVLRVVHVVPDVELFALLGEPVLPVVQAGTVRAGIRDAFFLDNKLFKSTTPAQQRAQRLRLAQENEHKAACAA